MTIMSAQNLDLALRRGAPLEAPERWILEALCAAGDEFVTFSTLQNVSGVTNGHFYRAWGALLQRLYAACGCRVCKSKSKDKVYHVFDGLRLAQADEWSFRLPAPLRQVVAEWLAPEVAKEAQLQL